MFNHCRWSVKSTSINGVSEGAAEYYSGCSTLGWVSVLPKILEQTPQLPSNSEPHQASVSRAEATWREAAQLFLTLGILLAWKLRGTPRMAQGFLKTLGLTSL